MSTAAAGNWKSLMQSAIQNTRAKKTFMKLDWRMFSPAKVEFLLRFHNSSNVEGLLAQERLRGGSSSNLLKYLAEDRLFLNQVLITCLDQNTKQISSNFEQLVEFLENDEGAYTYYETTPISSLSFLRRVF